MEKRVATRNAVWDHTEARVRFKEMPDPRFGSAETVIRGRVDNLGSKGLFLKTGQPIPSGRELDIRIVFQPQDPVGPILDAKGEVVRTEARGVAIRFTQIDLDRLGACIFQMLGGESEKKTTTP